MNVIDAIHYSCELQSLEDNIELEVSRLIRKHLENSSFDFIGGNDLDVLIDTNVDIESIVSKALIERKNND